MDPELYIPAIVLPCVVFCIILLYYGLNYAIVKTQTVTLSGSTHYPAPLATVTTKPQYQAQPSNKFQAQPSNQSQIQRPNQSLNVPCNNADSLMILANEILAEAVQEDARGNYRSAFDKYINGIELLHKSLLNWKSGPTRKIITKKILEYLDRAEYLKYLDGLDQKNKY